MVKAIARHYWEDGTRTHLEIEIPDSMPDGIDEARVQVMRMLRSTLGEPEVATTLEEPADEHAEGDET